MKHFTKLISSLLVFCIMSVHAQKQKVEFPYSHASLTELLKDTNWPLAIINPLQKKNDSLWQSREYHFSSTDRPQTIVAANFQVFDKKDFPASQIWVNKKEIPGNGLDDDRNGFIDDINGVMYKWNKKLASANVP